MNKTISPFVTNTLNKMLSALALSFPILWLLVGAKDFVVICLLALYLLSRIYAWPQKKVDIIEVIALIFCIVIAGEFFWHAKTIPTNIFSHETSLKYFKFFFFFYLIAYGTISRHLINPFWILISAATGISLFILFKIPISDWQISLLGDRPKFGFRNAQHAGVVFASCLICVGFFYPRMYRFCSNRYKPLLSVWLLLFSVSLLWILVTTQVRAVWLGLFAALITTCILVLRNLKTYLMALYKKNLKEVIVGVIGIITCAFFLLTINSFERINKRLSAEDITYQSIEIASHFQQKELTSSGIRIASWSAALDWGSKHPILGWGYKAAPELIKQDQRLTNPMWRQFGHLHNSYFEAWIAMGLLGLVLMSTVIVYVGMQVIKSASQNNMPEDVYLFSWAFISFWLTVNFFESYINYSSGFYVVSIITGFIYSFCMQRQFKV